MVERYTSPHICQALEIHKLVRACFDKYEFHSNHTSKRQLLVADCIQKNAHKLIWIILRMNDSKLTCTSPTYRLLSSLFKRLSCFVLCCNAKHVSLWTASSLFCVEGRQEARGCIGLLRGFSALCGSQSSYFPRVPCVGTLFSPRATARQPLVHAIWI